MQSQRLFSVLLCLVAYSCEKAQNMIDPTGRSYRDTTKPAVESPKKDEPKKQTDSKPTEKEAAKPAPPVPAPPSTPPDSPPPVKTFRLDPAQAWSLASESPFEISGVRVQFKKGVWRVPGKVVSLVDAQGKPWGMGIGDVNFDGGDDVFLLVRVDHSGSPPAWKLALLKNLNGKLYQTQIVDLPANPGYERIDVAGTGVTLIPSEGGTMVHASIVGGNLAVD